MNNIYDITPLKVLIVNPYNSNVINKISLPSLRATGSTRMKGGDFQSRDKLQMADFSILD